MYENTSDVHMQEVRTPLVSTRTGRRKGVAAAKVRELYQPVLERLAKGEKEEWRDVPGYEGYLIASSLGRVARLQGFGASKGYAGVSVVDGVGFHEALHGQVNIKKNERTLPLHRVVAVTFLGDPPRGMNDVNHIDGDKKNNAVDNIEWCTRKHNLAHARRLGLNTSGGLKKYTVEQYQEVRRLRAMGWKLREIVAAVGMTRPGVVHVLYVSKRGL